VDVPGDLQSYTPIFSPSTLLRTAHSTTVRLPRAESDQPEVSTTLSREDRCHDGAFPRAERPGYSTRTNFSSGPLDCPVHPPATTSPSAPLDPEGSVATDPSLWAVIHHGVRVRRQDLGTTTTAVHCVDLLAVVIHSVCTLVAPKARSRLGTSANKTKLCSREAFQTWKHASSTLP
jgi:hypothetical protein